MYSVGDVGRKREQKGATTQIQVRPKESYAFRKFKDLNEGN